MPLRFGADVREMLIVLPGMAGKGVVTAAARKSLLGRRRSRPDHHCDYSTPENGHQGRLSILNGG